MPATTTALWVVAEVIGGIFDRSRSICYPASALLHLRERDKN